MSIRSQIIHINSVNRVSGTPGDFRVQMDHALHRLENFKGTIRVEPVQCVVNRSWYTIDDSNNTFAVFDGETLYEYEVPVGFYNVKSFIQTLGDLLKGWLLGWEQLTNTYSFRPPNNGLTYNLIMSSYVCVLMGLDFGKEYEVSYDAPLRSLRPVKMTHESVLLVHSELPRSKMSAVDNLNTPQMRESTILLKIPILEAPFDNLCWRSNSRDIISFDLTQSYLSQMHIWLTDEFGRAIRPAYDWTISLRVDYIENTVDQQRETVDLLRSIKDYVRFAILSQPRSRTTSSK